jgi:hypothetical protein
MLYVCTHLHVHVGGCVQCVDWQKQTVDWHGHVPLYVYLWVHGYVCVCVCVRVNEYIRVFI